MQYTIQKTAEIAGVTQKALRHYDKLMLLVPSDRTEAGYRLYSEKDIEKLQQILFFRELDFPLARIRDIVNDPAFDRREALAVQAEFLEARANRYLELSSLAKKTLKSMEGEEKMEPKEMFEAFDYDKMMEHEKQYESEVKERWGDTDAYKISKKRSAGYSKEDWAKISAENDANLKETIDCFKAQVAANDARMMQVCEKSRQYIDKNFYPCSKEMFACLGNMYVSDPRFTEYYDKFVPGLAAYYNEAIQHYCKQK